MTKRLAIVILVGALPLVGRASLIHGIFAPIHIAGSSMAPTLLGPHYQVTCNQCRYPFSVGNDQISNDADSVLCTNCGNWTASPQHDDVLPGERVWMDAYPARFGSLRRWDVVAFRAPDNLDRLQVKRIVGLPGEQITVRAGDLYADGELIRKSMTELCAVAIPVHNAGYPVASHGWLPIVDKATNPNGLDMLQLSDTDKAAPCFDFRPWNAGPWNSEQTPDHQQHAAPIYDLVAGNDSVRRTLEPVNDLLVQFDLRSTKASAMRLELSGHGRRLCNHI